MPWHRTKSTINRHLWITHAKTFPFFPHIIQVKSKHFVKTIFNQDQPHQTQSTMYFRYLQNQIRTLDFDFITLASQQMLTAKSTFELLSFAQSQHDRFMAILQYYSIQQTKPVTIDSDDQFHALHQQITVSYAWINPAMQWYYLVLTTSHVPTALKKTEKNARFVELPSHPLWLFYLLKLCHSFITST